jgi:hypothetical protein
VLKALTLVVSPSCSRNGAGNSPIPSCWICCDCSSSLPTSAVVGHWLGRLRFVHVAFGLRRAIVNNQAKVVEAPRCCCLIWYSMPTAINAGSHQKTTHGAATNRHSLSMVLASTATMLMLRPIVDSVTKVSRKHLQRRSPNLQPALPQR